jgi:hypothetical protein
MKFFIAALLVFVFSSTAHAWPRRNYATPNYSTPNVVKSSSYTVNIPSASSDQERCQAEANYMAANNITGHVWGVIGSFEGVGYGSSPSCATCTPSGNMSLTGDASAQGRNGMWYRVRSWR